MNSKSFFLCMLLLYPALLFAVDYDFMIKREKMTFEWKVDGDKLHIQLGAKTKGWVGIGFNPEEHMKGANILIGNVKKGKVSVRDDIGTGTESHSSDTKSRGKSNVSDVSGSEKNGYTKLRFTIPLNSGDAKDTIIEPHKDTIVLLAYGRSDSFRLGHKFTAMLKVNLGTGASGDYDHHH